MTTKREPSTVETETLKAVLVGSLTGAYQQDMKDLAITCARSVKAAFDELYTVSEEPLEKCS